LVYFFDGSGDLCKQDGHVLNFLDEDILIWSFLVGVHFILDLIDIEDHTFDVDIFDESLDHVLQDVLRSFTTLTS
jgi:hypothetical protein